MQTNEEMIRKIIGLESGAELDNEKLKALGYSIVTRETGATTDAATQAESAMDADGTGKAIVFLGGAVFLFAKINGKVIEVPNFDQIPAIDVKLDSARELLKTFMESVSANGFSMDSIGVLMRLFAYNCNRKCPLDAVDNIKAMAELDFTKNDIEYYRPIIDSITTTVQHAIYEGLCDEFRQVLIEYIRDRLFSLGVGFNKKSVEIAASFLNGDKILVPWFNLQACAVLKEKAVVCSKLQDIVTKGITDICGCDFHTINYFEGSTEEMYDSILLPLPMIKLQRIKNPDKELILTCIDQLNDNGVLAILTFEKFGFSSINKELRSYLYDNYHVRNIISVEGGVDGSMAGAFIIIIEKSDVRGKTQMTRIPHDWTTQKAMDLVEHPDKYADPVSMVVELDNDSWIYSRYLPHEIPSFETVALGDIAKIRTGASVPSKDLFSPDSFSGIPYLRGADIIDGKIVPDNAMKAGSKYSSKQVPPGDILLNTRSKVYSACIVSPEEGPYVPASTFNVIEITDRRFIPEYLALVMRSSQFYEEAESLKTGVTIRTLANPALASIRIPALPLEAQQAIIDDLRGSEYDQTAIDKELEKYLS